MSAQTCPCGSTFERTDSSLHEKVNERKWMKAHEACPSHVAVAEDCGHYVVHQESQGSRVAITCICGGYESAFGESFVTYGSLLARHITRARAIGAAS